MTGDGASWGFAVGIALGGRVCFLVGVAVTRQRIAVGVSDTGMPLPSGGEFGSCKESVLQHISLSNTRLTYVHN